MQTIRLICHPGCDCEMCALESSTPVVFLSMDNTDPTTQYEFGPTFGNMPDYRHMPSHWRAFV